MVRAIAAIDSKRGLTKGEGIIWNLPSDKLYFRSKTEGQTIIMGYGEYLAQNKTPLPNRRNIVASRRSGTVSDGFEKTNDARDFIESFTGDIWITGGAKLFEQTLDLIEELHITQLDKDFHCDKFFPEFKNKFNLVEQSDPVTENGITFTFQAWKTK